MNILLHVKHTLFSSYFRENFILSTNFRKAPNTKFHENPSSGAEFFLVDRQTGRSDEANSRFHAILLKRKKEEKEKPCG